MIILSDDCGDVLGDLYASTVVKYFHKLLHERLFFIPIAPLELVYAFGCQ